MFKFFTRYITFPSEPCHNEGKLVHEHEFPKLLHYELETEPLISPNLALSNLIMRVSEHYAFYVH